MSHVVLIWRDLDGWVEAYGPFGSIDSAHDWIRANPDAGDGAVKLQVVPVTASGTVAWCSNCGSRYEPTRRPAAGRRNYCPSCRGSADQRDASRAYRERCSVALSVGDRVKELTGSEREGVVVKRYEKHPTTGAIDPWAVVEFADGSRCSFGARWLEVLA